MYESSELHYGEVVLTPTILNRSLSLHRQGTTDLDLQIMILNATSDQVYNINVEAVATDGTKTSLYAHDVHFTQAYNYVRYVGGQVEIPSTAASLSVTATKVSGLGTGAELYAFIDTSAATAINDPIDINNQGSGDNHGNPSPSDVLEFRKGTSEELTDKSKSDCIRAAYRSRANYYIKRDSHYNRYSVFTSNRSLCHSCLASAQ